MDVQEVVCGGTDWIDVAEDRDRYRAHVTAVMNKPCASLKCKEFQE